VRQPQARKTRIIGFEGGWWLRTGADPIAGFGVVLLLFHAVSPELAVSIFRPRIAVIRGVRLDASHKVEYRLAPPVGAEPRGWLLLRGHQLDVGDPLFLRRWLDHVRAALVQRHLFGRERLHLVIEPRLLLTATLDVMYDRLQLDYTHGPLLGLGDLAALAQARGAEDEGRLKRLPGKHHNWPSLRKVRIPCGARSRSGGLLVGKEAGNGGHSRDMGRLRVRRIETS